MAHTNPSPEDALELFRDIEEAFPSHSQGGDKWYILTLCALTAGGHPGFAGNLYEYLISKPEYASDTQRQGLVRRLREALVKSVSVIGVPKPLEAIFSIGELQREEDKDYSFSREKWQSGQENAQRGKDWLAQIYRHNDLQTQELMAAHKDFRWLSVEITYGLYLSDHSILGPVETELVVLAGIMMQNMARETGWHLRGTRRIGVSAADVEVIQQCVSGTLYERDGGAVTDPKLIPKIEKVAAFCGMTLNKVPRVKDIEHEV